VRSSIASRGKNETWFATDASASSLTSLFVSLSQLSLRLSRRWFMIYVDRSRAQAAWLINYENIAGLNSWVNIQKGQQVQSRASCCKGHRYMLRVTASWTAQFTWHVAAENSHRPTYKLQLNYEVSWQYTTINRLTFWTTLYMHLYSSKINTSQCRILRILEQVEWTTV